MLWAMPSVVIQVTASPTLAVTSWGWKAMPTVLTVGPEPEPAAVDALEAPAVVVVPEDELSLLLLLQAVATMAVRSTAPSASRARARRQVTWFTARIVRTGGPSSTSAGTPPRPGGMGRGARPTRSTGEPEPCRQVHGNDGVLRLRVKGANVAGHVAVCTPSG